MLRLFAAMALFFMFSGAESARAASLSECSELQSQIQVMKQAKESLMTQLLGTYELSATSMQSIAKGSDLERVRESLGQSVQSLRHAGGDMRVLVQRYLDGAQEVHRQIETCLASSSQTAETRL